VKPEYHAQAIQPSTNSNVLLEHYQNCIEMGDISFDPQQKLIMLELQRVYNDLVAPIPQIEEKTTFDKLIARTFSLGEKQSIKNPLVEGLYIWGGVGSGKTHMVDFFFKYLPIENKMRLHFHRFMQLVHEDLKKHSHIESPLKVVAKLFSDKTRILCLDEMHVNDITDAMILAQLFSHLFDYGVTLITTSNVPPKDLYKDGLQRSRFLPTITLFEEKTKVIKINSDTDYRLRLLEQADVYQVLNSSNNIKQNADKKMLDYFNSLTAINRHKKRNHVLINNRKIPVIKWADGIAWFSFENLCETNRSTEDYIQISHFFHTVMISDIPIMSSMQNDAARRFVNMIDEFYDRHVNVIVTAEALPTELYIGSRLAFEFERTASRLIEMQSKQYLAKKRGVNK